MKRALIRLALRLGWRPRDRAMEAINAQIAANRAAHRPVRYLMDNRRELTNSRLRAEVARAGR